MTNGREDYVDVKTVAKHLGVAESFIYKLVTEKKLPFYRPGSKILFKLSEVDVSMQKEYRYA